MQACLDLFFLRLFSAAMNLSSAGVTASDHDGPAILSVGEVARRSGITVSALHFYERQGLIESLRTPGNQRRYARAVLRRVAVIRVAQRMGVPLAEIAEALQELPSGAHAGRLERAVRALAPCAGCAHPGADPAARPDRRLHWLRLPVPQGLPAAQ